MASHSTVLAVGAALLCFISNIAHAQSAPPTSIAGVFDPDLADIKPAGLAALKEAAEKAQAGADCYPPRVTFTAQARSGPGEDPDFAHSLADARTRALQEILPSLGLTSDQGQIGLSLVRSSPTAALSDDDVVASFDPFNAGEDKAAPLLKVNSTPAKDTLVKPGDKIAVLVTASDRYSDAGTSWPTGVQSIQLLADDGLVDSKYYSKPPDPCAVQTFSATYIVPRNPPTTVHLSVLSEDGAGNQTTKTADFPTGDLWEGTYTVHGVLPGMMDETLSTDFNMLVGADGKITGTGHAHVSIAPGKPDSGPCDYSYSITPPDFSLAFGGRRNGDELDLQFEPTPITLTARTDCRSPLRSVVATVPESISILMGPLALPTIKAADDATNSFHVPDYDGSIEIHRPNQTSEK